MDITGKTINTIANENLSAGYYNYNVDVSAYTNGTYFISIQSDNINKTLPLIKH